MNILHVSSANSWRGGEQQIEYLIIELQKLGVQNHLFTPHMSALTERNLQESCYIHTYKKRSSFNPLLGFNIKDIIHKYCIDIVHVHDSHGLNYSITASLLGPYFPIVLSRRTDFLPKSVKKYNYKGIQSIVCVSDHVRNIMTEIVNNQNILTTVYDGIDLHRSNFEKTGLRKKFGIPDSAILIANTSALADHKDYPTFIETAAVLASEGSFDCRFMIIGDDAGSKMDIVKMVADLGLTDRVTITGFIPESYKLLAEMDIFLFTSKKEGLGSTLLEAMLNEVPIVSTAVGGAKEFLIAEENSLLCPIGDHNCLASQIRKLLTNESLRKKIIKGGKQTVQKFSTKVMAEKTLSIYQEVLNNTYN